MDVNKLVLDKLKKVKRVKTSDILKTTGFSQPYVQRFLAKLTENGLILKVGRGKNTYYISADSKNPFENILHYKAKLVNSSLSESDIFETIVVQTGIFSDAANELTSLVRYAFTEMLNNAIDHSESKTIDIFIEKENEIIRFEITDKGIGIFNNIRKKYKLNDVYEAVQELLKGKRTTMPERHTGEGIFFTSKAADTFIIQSSNKRLIINNNISDVFLGNTKFARGTKIIFTLRSSSKKTLKQIFDEYSDDEYKFSKTKIYVKLYKFGDEFISRSQAKRILYGLESFDSIVLDFKDVKLVGQAFADEIFRVYARNNKGKKISYINTNNNIEFMLKRAINNEM